MRSIFFATLMLAATGTASSADDAAAEKLRAGTTLMSTQVYSLEDDRKILKAFEGLRVADVTDGMDFVGLKNIGLMDPEIHPVWKDFKDYRHRFIGIAVTVRCGYVPTQRGAPPAGLTYEEFRAREGKWYNEISPEPFVALMREGPSS